ncbi:MAG: hypothetical protein COS92_01690 [Desulfobacterales bacterium CG07_land_8_20_14_0_80_52_14]|nr:MAG: hypothetical protein COS92_01690 [Desulfobacterales bacterium CG07_land_8_20_14_0_80_52_14]
MATENSPGMQARLNEMPFDFLGTYPFRRQSETDTTEFYRNQRVVYHIDQKAGGHVRDIYGRLLKPGSKVLDLMSSWVSHLPDDLPDLDVTGLGMNAEELKANPALARFVIHDLNASPELPFDDQGFDAVICTSSVEYLIRPIEVFSDIACILKPGGIL